MKNPESIKKILEETIKQMGLKKGLDENKVLSLWDKAVGKKISSKSSPEKIIKGVLYVKAQSPAWSHQLSLMSEEIKNKLNKACGENMVKQIRFKN